MVEQLPRGQGDRLAKHCSPLALPDRESERLGSGDGEQMTTMNTTDQPRAVACIRFVRRCLTAIQRWWLQLRCHHEWKVSSRARYDVMRGDGSKEGEVTITLLECEKCCADKLFATDRTHTPNK